MIFNIEKARKHTMNDEELLKDILIFTLKDIPPMIDNLKQQLEEGKGSGEIAELAHKIKGSAGAVGAEILYDTLFELEITANEGDRSRFKEQIGMIEKAFDDFHRDKEVLSLI
jgi:HPt (histidine-containing phosphotransfer) domain-containing protein